MNEGLEEMIGEAKNKIEKNNDDLGELGRFVGIDRMNIERIKACVEHWIRKASQASREEAIEIMENKLEKFQIETDGNESDLFRGIEKGYENMIESLRNPPTL